MSIEYRLLRMNNFTFLLPIMTLISVSVLTPWQLLQSLCPYVSAQSRHCPGTITQQQQPFTQQQQPSTTVLPSTQPQLISPP
jgi:hypothetical protein